MYMFFSFCSFIQPHFMIPTISVHKIVLVRIKKVRFRFRNCKLFWLYLAEIQGIRHLQSHWETWRIRFKVRPAGGNHSRCHVQPGSKQRPKNTKGTTGFPGLQGKRSLQEGLLYMTLRPEEWVKWVMWRGGEDANGLGKVLSSLIGKRKDKLEL